MSDTTGRFEVEVFQMREPDFFADFKGIRFDGPHGGKTEAEAVPVEGRKKNKVVIKDLAGFLTLCEKVAMFRLDSEGFRSAAEDAYALTQNVDDSWIEYVQDGIPPGHASHVPLVQSEYTGSDSVGCRSTSVGDVIKIRHISTGMVWVVRVSDIGMESVFAGEKGAGV